MDELKSIIEQVLNLKHSIEKVALKLSFEKMNEKKPDCKPGGIVHGEFIVPQKTNSDIVEALKNMTKGIGGQAKVYQSRFRKFDTGELEILAKNLKKKILASEYDQNLLSEMESICEEIDLRMSSEKKN